MYRRPIPFAPPHALYSSPSEDERGRADEPLAANRDDLPLGEAEARQRWDGTPHEGHPYLHVFSRRVVGRDEKLKEPG